MKKIGLTLLLILGAGCDDGGAVFVDHLAIVNINPSHGAVGIGYDTDVTVTFSEVLQAQTVTATSICMTSDDAPPADPLNPCAGTTVLATVSYDAATLSARLAPGSPLLPDRRYTVHLTTGLSGDASGSLPAVVSASFRTIPTM